MMLKIYAPFLAAFFAIAAASVPGLAETKTILALGDSLTAGYGLPVDQAFPIKLEQALKANGHDVVVVNGGVSGDTAAQGESRLEWSLSEDVDAVIVELGANDALRGLDPGQAETALRRIMDTLKKRELPVLLAGMRAPPNLGPEYQAAFDPMFDRIAKDYDAVLYPFFLDGVAADPALNQSDGIHPNERGVAKVVERILPAVEVLLGRIR
jgi:acyl-CoA thioesterase I